MIETLRTFTLMPTVVQCFVVVGVTFIGIAVFEYTSKILRAMFKYTSRVLCAIFKCKSLTAIVAAAGISIGLYVGLSGEIHQAGSISVGIVLVVLIESGIKALKAVYTREQ